MSERDLIRIPNLPFGQIVDDKGNPTDDELTFRQALVSSLQQYMGDEGLVPPTQSEVNKDAIQNHTNSQGQYTCALGTILYVIPDPLDYTQDKVMIAVRNSNDYPDSAPLFKTVTLT